MTSRTQAPVHLGVPITLIVGSCVSLQFGAALAVQLFPSLGTWAVTALRLSIAAILLVVVARPRIARWTRAQWAQVVWFGASLAGMNGCFYAALERIPLGPAVAIEFIGPLVLAAVLSRRVADFACVGVAVVGICLFGLDSLWGADPLDPIGVVFVLIAAAFWALYIRKSARVGHMIPGLGGLAMALVVASVLLIPFGVPAVATLATQTDLIWLALGTAVFASVVPYTLELFALRRLPQRVFGILVSLEPVFAALFGWILLGQAIGWVKIAAIALVVAASAGTALTAKRTPDGEPIEPPVLTGSLPTVTGAISVVNDEDAPPPAE